MPRLPELTTAAHQALDQAARWFADGLPAETAAPDLLLGLLAEPEWRAAQILGKEGVDLEQVRRKWPRQENGHHGTARQLAPELHGSLGMVAAWTRRQGLPSHLATEHLLLAILENGDDTAAWLSERGITKASLREQILQVYDATPKELGPPIDMPDDISSRLSPRDEARTANDSAAPSHVASSPGQPVLVSRSETATSDTALLRILDAAANRASEGLRVVEDYVRFALDDRHLMRLAKELRHDLTAALATIPRAARMAARDTLADVGATVSTEAEFIRTDLASVAAASSERVAQALRSLEEYAKLLSPTQAAQLAALRYRHYTFQRAMSLAGESRARLAHARLYVLVDGGADEAGFARRVAELVTAGVDVLQLRDKKLDDRTLLARGRQLRELTAGTATLFIMNDRPDLAVLCEADGVHVGQEELSVKDVRAIVGPRALIGVSTHSLDQARRAVLEGANYLGVGPTFPSGTKQFAAFPGLELVSQVAAEISLPWFAIGGIGPENIGQVVQAGASRVAVSGAVWGAANPSETAESLKGTLHARK